MTLSDYARATRAPRYSVPFAAPLFLLYEAFAWTVGGGGDGGVRNGAEVWLKWPFIAVGDRAGLMAFYVILLAAALGLILRDWRRGSVPSPRVFGGMAAEAVLYAPVFWLVVARLTAALLDATPLSMSLAQGVVLSLGAGLYEELLFRVLLVGALLWVARRLLGWRPETAAVGAVIVGALVFSAAHYVGALGDRFSIESFVYRWIGGMVLSGLYVTRGFGITAWTHALYDVLIVLT
jgi:CAAX prenyl protease-like protein